MKRISSHNTFIFKKVFPVFWFGFLVFFIAISFPAAARGGDSIMFLIVPVFMMAVGYFLMKKLIFPLMDEVWDDGRSLLIVNGGERDTVDYKNIKNICYTAFSNPNRVTVSLRVSCKFGDEITFASQLCLIPFRIHQEILDLIDRVDRARFE